jgi:riboflavin synthase
MKGSICINGVSLTIALLEEDVVGVALIPYTLEHTTFHSLQQGDLVNVEFDILSKHMARYAMLQHGNPFFANPS